MDVRVILPEDITGSTTNINPEDPGTEWVSGPFNTGEEAWSANTHLVYKSAIDANNDDPEIGVIADPPTWTVARPTNRHAMYSDVIQEQTAFADLIENTYDSSGSIGFVNSVAIFGMEANEIQIIATSATFGGEFLNETISLTDNSPIINRFQYRYAPFIFRVNGFGSVFTSYSDTLVTVRIKNTGGTAKAGKVVIGENLNLGSALAGVTYEPKVTGRTIVTNGKTEYITESVQQTIRGQVKIETVDSGVVASAIGRKVGANPVAFSFDDRYDVLQTYGIVSTKHSWNPQTAQRVSVKAVSLEGSE